MAKKLEVTVTENSIIFVDSASQKIVEQTKFEDAETDMVKAVRGLKAEVNGRGNATRFALSVLVQILDNPRFDGYKGQTPIRERVPAELKGALRQIEDEFLGPIFRDTLPKSTSPADAQVQWDGFIKELREPGVYARVRGVAVKYFAYFGRLPCVYDGEGQAVKDKLLAVSAIEKLMQMEAAKHPADPVDDSIASKLGQLMFRMSEEKDALDVNTLQIIIGRCELFAQEAKELLNSKNAAATAASHLRAVMEKKGDVITGKVTADNTPTQEQSESFAPERAPEARKEPAPSAKGEPRKGNRAKREGARA